MIFNKFNSFVQAIAHKKHDLSADIIKVVLSNIAPTAGLSVLGDISQIAAGNGYVLDGQIATRVSSGQTGGLYSLFLNNVTFIASGGSMAPFRYATAYNSSAPSLELIGWWDYGSPVTLADTENFLVVMDSVNGVLTLQ